MRNVPGLMSLMTDLRGNQHVKHHAWTLKCLLSSGHWQCAQHCLMQAGLLVGGGADLGQEAGALIVP